MGLKTPFIWISSWIRSFDIYGKSISFTYKGEDQYKTLMGGCITIVIKVLMVVFAWNLALSMLNRNNTISSVNTIINDIRQDNELLNLTDTEFSFIIRAHYKLNNRFRRLVRNDTIFSLSVNQYTRSGSSENDNVNRTANPINIGLWSNEYFNASSAFDSIFQTGGALLWLDSYDFELKGNKLSSEFKYVDVTISKCQNSSESRIPWKPDSVIQEAIDSLQVSVFLIDQYLDLDSYDEPIKTYINDKYDYYGISGLMNEARFYIQQNEAKLNDHYLEYLNNDETEKFISIGKSDSLLRNSQETDVFKATFLKSEGNLIYERNVYTLLNLIGDLGGIFEILFIFGTVLTSTFNSKMFYYSVLSSLYQVDTEKCGKNHTFQIQRQFDNEFMQNYNINRSNNEESKCSSQTTNQIDSARALQCSYK